MAVSSRWLNARAAQNYIFHPQHADQKTRVSVSENFVVQIFILMIRVINTKVEIVKNRDHQRNGFSSTRQDQGYCSGT